MISFEEVKGSKIAYIMLLCRQLRKPFVENLWLSFILWIQYQPFVVPNLV